MPRAYQVAKIDESLCIGCTKCIQVCPFDAIIGANKQMHVVLTSLCIGCDLCLPPCPVDAISLIEVSAALPVIERAQDAKKRHQARKRRLARIEQEKQRHDMLVIEDMENVIAQSMKRAVTKNESVEKNQWEHHE